MGYHLTNIKNKHSDGKTTFKGVKVHFIKDKGISFNEKFISSLKDLEKLTGQELVLFNKLIEALKLGEVDKVEGGKEEYNFLTFNKLKESFKEEFDKSNNKELKEVSNKVSFINTYPFLTFITIGPITAILFLLLMYFSGLAIKAFILKDIYLRNDDTIILGIIFYIFTFIVINLFLLLYKNIKRGVRLFKHKSKLRKLPLTTEELIKNNLNSFSSYSNYLINNLIEMKGKYDLNIFLTRKQEDEVTSKLQELFLKDCDEDFKITECSVNIILERDFKRLSQDYTYTLQENIYCSKLEISNREIESYRIKIQIVI